MKKFVLTLTILVVFIHNTEAGEVRGLCGGFLQKLGCYQKAAEKRNRKLPFNDFMYDGRKDIVWQDYYASIRTIVCKCSREAIKKGYNAIGIQFYGECWGANKNITTYHSLRKSGRCRDGRFHTCNEEDKLDFCTGDGESTTVYLINLNTDTSKGRHKINGGYSKWSQWSPCLCDEGYQARERICNNPEPQFGGKECSGESEETRSCTCKKEKPKYVSHGCGDINEKEDFTNLLSLSPSFPSSPILSFSPLMKKPKQFCIVEATKEAKNPKHYTVSVDMYSVTNKKAVMGIFFNAKNDENYNFAYINIRNHYQCYNEGRVMNGRSHWNRRSRKPFSCHQRFHSQEWIHLKLKVSKFRVQFYANNVLLGDWDTHTKNTGKAGVLIRNPSFINKDRSEVHFKNLKIE